MPLKNLPAPLLLGGSLKAMSSSSSQRLFFFHTNFGAHQQALTNTRGIRFISGSGHWSWSGLVPLVCRNLLWLQLSKESNCPREAHVGFQILEIIPCSANAKDSINLSRSQSSSIFDPCILSEIIQDVLSSVLGQRYEPKICMFLLKPCAKY